MKNNNTIEIITIIVALLAISLIPYTIITVNRGKDNTKIELRKLDLQVEEISFKSDSLMYDFFNKKVNK